jgi:hypothetical protein
MAIKTTRLGAVEGEPFTSEVQSQVSAYAMLWHLSRKPGVQVVAKRAWALTDDFEAYFLYKGRLFLLQTPFVRLWLTLIGQPADEGLFEEVEAHLQSFDYWMDLMLPIAFARFFFTRNDPPKSLLKLHDPQGFNV